ncbi:MAG: hypothetical protein K2G51_06475 [Lachnospiraceae bacterium]|nr:hypothetical protein [Lachnospiraceae bacterium]
MRKKILSMTGAAILCVAALSGCQKAPAEVSDDNDVMHAQSALDGQIADIAEENTVESPVQQSGGAYDGTLGTTDNKIHISAQIPAIPENVYRITLKPDEDLDMDALTAFLGSPGGDIEDTSQALLDEIEESEYNNTHSDDGEAARYSLFGDHSALGLTDGEREASFSRHTSAGYIEYDLRDTYLPNAQTVTFIPVGQPDTGADFSVKEAEQILWDKLGTLGITEIAFEKIESCEGNGYHYYQFDFVPSYEGIAVIQEPGSGYGLGELYPWGSACVTPEGVAMLSLMDFCGKAAAREPVTVLSFEQVEKILEQYLDSNMIQGDERITLQNIALEYYPVPNLSPAERDIEYKPELELIPVWHIYMSLGDYVEAIAQIDGLDDVHYNICINAVTGEIERIS